MASLICNFVYFTEPAKPHPITEVFVCVCIVLYIRTDAHTYVRTCLRMYVHILSIAAWADRSSITVLTPSSERLLVSHTSGN